MIEIVEKSPITTWISDQSVIKGLLRYQTEWWEQGQYRMEKITGYITLVKKNHFLSGFQQKVFDYLDARGLEYSFESPEYSTSCQQPKLEGIDFKSWLQEDNPD
ncbi:unnamed protein product [marine sediment metagenome]|uniref:Uncharacterized protein n=1 Tax=marine sediment metagenome TaxID=412755 RepID=X1C6S8_9ZZZZ